ncbi:TetR/AcrR family transcriptional regulator [Leucobacter chromiiresistens]|uniref:TetR family transcriptional regulator n=1 Tax=Leucobacter chromiiresistens TaxID=1079994 RepID=A0A147ERP4_9MICO|nr:TetR/AcrR family transcriptional regulator [Leucobacter chromiiresistens]KTR87180.1 TetR family transcriptional regulator [Leucobacter chromiiresistens]
MSNDARERILTACEQTIARSGIRGFRMHDVASAAGVSIGLLAYHFGDRNGLLQAALDHVTERAEDRARRSPEPATASARLSALLSSEFGAEPEVRAGSTAWNELRALAVFEPAQAVAVARSTATWQQTVQQLVAEAVRDRGSDLDPAATALILTALVEGLSGRWLTGQLTAEEAQECVSAALRGLGL